MSNSYNNDQITNKEREGNKDDNDDNIINIENNFEKKSMKKILYNNKNSSDNINSRSTKQRQFVFRAKPNWTLLSQGAEARLWKIPNYLPCGKSAIAKERFPKSYRHPVLDQRLTKSRSKAEAKALERARKGGVYVPDVHAIQFPVLYLEYLDGPTVRQQLEEVHQNYINKKRDCQLDENIENKEFILETLAKQIGSMIAKLHHNCRTVHGDLTTSNMILMPSSESEEKHSNSQNKRIYMIDFGLARVSTNIEEMAVDLYVLERALQSTHPELEGTSFFSNILKAYHEEEPSINKDIASTNKKKICSKDAVLNRLNAVRLRGRKRECFG
eukprot:CAMPEP_0194191552 /NCGR_PEP_ID=MMETSP0154-20130528/67062_1 /TAXON_ID=1049557 /ORGANISM="Thalassiothrix antarctica, Strain L6-D1" /LENGTH=328 /DNA_ID=CAMNT_0038914253 /DNA_START=38 /DNA_END=1024 /DNA_ORIENTATION=+